MNGNFDCTQFISFDSNICEKQVKKMMAPFEELGFVIIIDGEIKPVKRKYFKNYISQHFTELKYDNFIGEFEDWEEICNPPTLIKKFVNNIHVILKKEDISNFKLILTSFAEEGTTTNKVIILNKDQIIKGIYSMSKHNFDIWVDNLILKLI
jgi:hypothetical protein